MASSTFILGGGVTGLAAGYASGLPVLEAADVPGGICASYYVRPGQAERSALPPDEGEAYRFEIGGGHWIFGGDPLVLRLLDELAPMRRYARRSGIYFAEAGQHVPYPIQNNLGALPRETAARAVAEMVAGGRGTPVTMAEALRDRFGETLDRLFFSPFHERYTAGLWTEIGFQDAYKSPLDLEQVVRGAFGASDAAGYNVTFAYPAEGLSVLAHRLAERCDVRYGHVVEQIDVGARRLHLSNGQALGYDRLLSTLPLRTMLELAGLETEAPADPYSSVLVVNIGAERGPRCPDDHWLYVPDAAAGFHRVGCYSNVDLDFVPGRREDRVSLYIETAYPGGRRPDEAATRAHVDAVVEELQAWGFIGEVEVADPTWIDYAYTWAWPGSAWTAEALALLEAHSIWMTGRYGRWVFQGIADSVRDGLWAGASLRGEAP